MSDVPINSELRRIRRAIPPESRMSVLKGRISTNSMIITDSPRRPSPLASLADICGPTGSFPSTRDMRGEDAETFARNFSIAVLGREGGRKCTGGASDRTERRGKCLAKFSRGEFLGQKRKKSRAIRKTFFSPPEAVGRKVPEGEGRRERKRSDERSYSFGAYCRRRDAIHKILKFRHVVSRCMRARALPRAGARLVSSPSALVATPCRFPHIFAVVSSFASRRDGETNGDTSHQRLQAA